MSLECHCKVEKKPRAEINESERIQTPAHSFIELLSPSSPICCNRQTANSIDRQRRAQENDGRRMSAQETHHYIVFYISDI